VAPFETEWAAGLSDQLLRRSFHEASHAVVGTAVGIRVVETLVVGDLDDEDEGGHTTFDIPDSEFPVKVQSGLDFSTPIALDHPIASRWWIATRAGGVGSVVGMAMLGKTVTYDELMHDTVLSDDAELRDAMNRLSDEERAEWVDRRYRETWGLVLKHRPQVFAVARWLSTDLCLTGEQVDVVMEATDYVARNVAGETLLTIDEVESGKALAHQMRLEVWPASTAYLQRIADWLEGHDSETQ
jgi:hypothetical protein